MISIELFAEKCYISTVTTIILGWKNKMKKVFAIALAASVLAFLSCESTKQESAAQCPEPNKVEQASTPAAPAEKEVKKESAPVSTAISSKSQYKKLLQDIKISVLSSPRETVKGKAFASPYKIQVTNLAGEPLASLKMTAEYAEDHARSREQHRDGRKRRRGIHSARSRIVRLGQRFVLPASAIQRP